MNEFEQSAETPVVADEAIIEVTPEAEPTPADLEKIEAVEEVPTEEAPAEETPVA